MTTRTTLTSALIAGSLIFGATSCANTEASSTSAPATVSAARSAAATPAPPVRPASVLLDMTNTAIDPAVIEAYADPSVGDDISAAAEDFIRVGLSFPELQKGSHKITSADAETVAPMRELVGFGLWSDIEEGLSSGKGTTFPPTVADGVTLEEAEDPANNRLYSADDSGISMVFRNDDMAIKLRTWDNGATGADIENLKVRSSFTTTEGEIVFVDRTFTFTMVLAEDGSWDLWDIGVTVDKADVVFTQEELDALPPV